MDTITDLKFIGALYHQSPGVLVLLDVDGNKITEILEISKIDVPGGVLSLNYVVHVPMDK